MSELGSLVIAVDPPLERALIRAAALSELNTTDFATLALWSAVLRACDGRASADERRSPPNGYSREFVEFIAAVCNEDPRSPITLLTREFTVPNVYHVRLDAERILDEDASFLPVMLLDSTGESGERPFEIPRAAMFAWAVDRDGRLYRDKQLSGYVDGHEAALQPWTV